MPENDKVRNKKAGSNEQATADQQGNRPTTEPEAPETVEEEEKPVEIEALQQELKKQREQSEYHLEQWKRTAANLENYRKRVEKERAELLKSGQAALIARLLPLLDDFERAFQTLPFALGSFTWTEGLALIDRKLSLILQQQGLKEIDALGKPFDPAQHQALLEEETTTYPDGHVIAVLQKGYALQDKVLRPAMVKIARNEQRSKTSSNARRTAPESTETEDEGRSETGEHKEENSETK
jgi:molecular chaperone GrpE